MTTPSLKRLLGPAAFLLAIAGTPGEAEAIPIIWGTGEEITHVGDLPPEVRRAVARELGHDVSVGFHYHRFHIFFLSLWTWGGQHVLFAGDQYWEPGEEGWQQLLGSDGPRRYGKPIWYRVPAGLALIGGVVGLGVIRSRLFPSDEDRAQRLMKDPRYQEALQRFAALVSAGPPGPDGRSAPPPTPPQAAFDEVVRGLADQRVPIDQAETNFRAILRAAGAPVPAA